MIDAPLYSLLEDRFRPHFEVVKTVSFPAPHDGTPADPPQEWNTSKPKAGEAPRPYRPGKAQVDPPNAGPKAPLPKGKTADQ